MRSTRVCFYGGTDLQGMPHAFVSEMAYAVLTQIERSVIVTGGFRYGARNREAISTDCAALEGAQKYTDESGRPLRECDQAPDGRPDIGGVVRMTSDMGIEVHPMQDKTARGRRLLAEQHDEWAIARRYMSLDSLAQARIRLIDTNPDELAEEVTPALETANR